MKNVSKKQQKARDKFVKKYAGNKGKKKTTTKKSKYLPIVEAKIKARKLATKFNIKSEKDWIRVYDAGKIPKNLPRNLKAVYGKH